MGNERLREYLVKGFVLDDKRLKRDRLGEDYFDELLERIRDIRASERMFYQKITDIYATAVDYDPSDGRPRVLRQGAEQAALGHPPATPPPS